MTGQSICQHVFRTLFVSLISLCLSLSLNNSPFSPLVSAADCFCDPLDYPCWDECTGEFGVLSDGLSTPYRMYLTGDYGYPADPFLGGGSFLGADKWADPYPYKGYPRRRKSHRRRKNINYGNQAYLGDEVVSTLRSPRGMGGVTGFSSSSYPYYNPYWYFPYYDPYYWNRENDNTQTIVRIRNPRQQQMRRPTTTPMRPSRGTTGGRPMTGGGGGGVSGADGEAGEEGVETSDWYGGYPDDYINYGNQAYLGDDGIDSLYPPYGPYFPYFPGINYGNQAALINRQAQMRGRGGQMQPPRRGRRTAGGGPEQQQQPTASAATANGDSTSTTNNPQQPPQPQAATNTQPQSQQPEGQNNSNNSNNSNNNNPNK